MMIVLPVVPVVYCSQLWMDEQQALNWMDAVMDAVNVNDCILDVNTHGGKSLSLSTSLPPSIISFYSERGEVLRIECDGTIKICEGYTSTEAGETFITTLKEIFNINVVRHNQEQQVETNEQAYERAMKLLGK